MSGSGGEVVAFAEGVEVGTVDGEEAEAAVQGVEFVEVEGHHEDPVREAVNLRGEPMVHHVAFVETGLHGGRGRGLT